MMVGLLNINKPSGMSSRRVVDIVARLAGTKRVGHAGTLDPLASGVLVVCVDWATRLVTFVQDRPKVYSARFLLGQTSNTDDITGTVVEFADAPRPTRAEVETELTAFRGTIHQVPPQFSAVHVGGRRAHKLARRGETVVLESRPIEVYRIDLVRYEFPEVDVRIECGSGTYIRSIARDLGYALGCGGVMSSLVRQRIGDFSISTAVTPQELSARPLTEWLIPPLAAVAHLPRHIGTRVDCEQLLRGRPLLSPMPTPWPPESLVAVVNDAGQLEALVAHDPVDELLRPRQVFGVRSDFVE